MSNKIKYSGYNTIEIPTLLLQNRNGNNYGKISNASNITVKENFNGANEVSFSVPKFVNGKENPMWNKLIDFKIVYIPEYQEKYEMRISLDEDNDVIKHATLTSLCEAELSNTILRNIEINTENDILNPLYDENFPTILYRNPYDVAKYNDIWSLPKYTYFDDLSATEKNKAKQNILRHSSLLHRILEKTPHYSIGTIEERIQILQREFSFSDTSVYDALNQISEEMGILFAYNSITRTISAYDLYNICYNDECSYFKEFGIRYRNEFYDKCPKCGSTHISGCYGKDTSILVSRNKLANSVSLETNADETINCMYIEGGDDVINAAVQNINPNGSSYIYYLSDFMKDDMSDELKTKIENYQGMSYYYRTQQEYAFSSDVADYFNRVVKYANDLFKDTKGYTEFEKIPSSNKYVGYNELIKGLYNAIDLDLFIQSSMLPTIDIDGMGIEDSVNNIVKGFASGFLIDGVAKYKNNVAIINLTSALQTTIENAIKGTADLFYSKAYYELTLNTKSLIQTGNNKKWTGTFTLKSLTQKDELGKYIEKTSSQIDLYIIESTELYIIGKVNKATADMEDLKSKQITSINLSDNDFKNQLMYYSMDELQNLRKSFNDCVNVVVDSFKDTSVDAEINKNELAQKYITFYENRVVLIDSAISDRQFMLDAIHSVYDYSNQSGQIYLHILNTQDALNLEKFLGNDYNTFLAYRREGTYSNSNFISDGMSNAELLTHANKLYQLASEDLEKNGSIIYILSADMNNLLILPEFQVLINNETLASSFDLGNWIKLKADDEVYKLRLLSYEVNILEDYSKINVEFSNANKLSNSISSIQQVFQQANSISNSYSAVAKQVEKSTLVTDVVQDWENDGFNATNTRFVNSDDQQLIIDNTGLLARKYDNYTTEYNPNQLKILSNGLYTTHDNWKTIDTGIGNISYKNADGDIVNGYGILAKAVVADWVYGGKIVGEQVDAKGLTVKNGNIETLKIDSDGNVSINAKELEIGGIAPPTSSEVQSLANAAANSAAGSVATSTSQNISSLSSVTSQNINSLSSGTSQSMNALSSENNKNINSLSSATSKSMSSISSTASSQVNSLSASTSESLSSLNSSLASESTRINTIDDRKYLVEKIDASEQKITIKNNKLDIKADTVAANWVYAGNINGNQITANGLNVTRTESGKNITTFGVSSDGNVTINAKSFKADLGADNQAAILSNLINSSSITSDKQTIYRDSSNNLHVNADTVSANWVYGGVIQGTQVNTDNLIAHKGDFDKEFKVNIDSGLKDEQYIVNWRIDAKSDGDKGKGISIGLVSNNPDQNIYAATEYYENYIQHKVNGGISLLAKPIGSTIYPISLEADMIQLRNPVSLEKSVSIDSTNISFSNKSTSIKSSDSITVTSNKGTYNFGTLDLNSSSISLNCNFFTAFETSTFSIVNVKNTNTLMGSITLDKGYHLLVIYGDFATLSSEAAGNFRDMWISTDDTSTTTMPKMQSLRISTLTGRSAHIHGNYTQLIYCSKATTYYFYAKSSYATAQQGTIAYAHMFSSSINS